jgi:hypothetical protein
VSQTRRFLIKVAFPWQLWRIMVTLNSRKYRSFSSFFQKWVRWPNIFFNKSVTLVPRNISGKFKKNLSTQFFRTKFRLFWRFLSTIVFYFSIMKSWCMYLVMYKFSGYLTELVLEIITVLFRAAKVFHTLEDQWIDMRVHIFAGASPENTHKKVFSLGEISNIYCVFLLRNANIFSFPC